jgi:hypothetical protein
MTLALTRLETSALEAALALLRADAAHSWAALAILDASAGAAGETAAGLLRRAVGADKARQIETARHLRSQAEASILAALTAPATDAAA